MLVPYPDGDSFVPQTGSTILNTTVTYSAPYTVPTGKMLVLLSIQLAAFNGSFRADAANVIEGDSGGTRSLTSSHRLLSTGASTIYPVLNDNQPTGVAHSTTGVIAISNIDHLLVFDAGTVLDCTNVAGNSAILFGLLLSKE